MPYRDSFCLWIGGNADANFHNVCWLWFCLWLEVKYKATKILLGRKMVQKLSLWISEWLEVFNSTLSSPLGLDGRIYQTSRGCRVRKCIYVKLLCVSLTDIFYEMEMCWHRLQGNTRNGWISEKNQVVHFPMKAEVFPTVFIWFPTGASTIERFYQLISSITLRCAAAGPSAEDLAVGQVFTDIFHASRWRLTAIKLTGLSYISRGSDWWGESHQPDQR